MDMAYATIPIMGGEKRKLYRETKLEYVINTNENPQNHPVYVGEANMGRCILALSDDYETLAVEEKYFTGKKDSQNDVWDLYFDGVYSKEGAGVGVVLNSPRKERLPVSMKL